MVGGGPSTQYRRPLSPSISQCIAGNEPWTKTVHGQLQVKAKASVGYSRAKRRFLHSQCPLVKPIRSTLGHSGKEETEDTRRRDFWISIGDRAHLLRWLMICAFPFMVDRVPTRFLPDVHHNVPVSGLRRLHQSQRLRLYLACYIRRNVISTDWIDHMLRGSASVLLVTIVSFGIAPVCSCSLAGFYIKGWPFSN